MGLLLLVGHLVFVGWLTLRPLAVPWVAPANVDLFATIHADLRQGPEHALHTLGGDLALLAPLGLLLPMASGTLGSRFGSFARTVFAAAMLSLALEALRSSVPGQVANVDAIVLHTVGAALAHLVCYPVVRAWLRRVAGPRPERKATAGLPDPGGLGGSGAAGRSGGRSGTAGRAGGVGRPGGAVRMAVADAMGRPSQGRPLTTPRVRIAPRVDVTRSSAPYV